MMTSCSQFTPVKGKKTFTKISDTISGKVRKIETWTKGGILIKKMCRYVERDFIF